MVLHLSKTMGKLQQWSLNVRKIIFSINVGTTPVLPNDRYNTFDVGTLPVGCVITTVQMNANGSIDPATPEQKYRVFTAASAMGGIGNGPFNPPVVQSLLFAGTPGTPIVQTGIVGTPNHTVTTYNFIILRVETDSWYQLLEMYV